MFSCGCDGAPACTLPHSHEELMEWQARHVHREQRRKTGSLQLERISPQMGSHGEGTPISASKVVEGGKKGRGAAKLRVCCVLHVGVASNRLQGIQDK